MRIEVILCLISLSFLAVPILLFVLPIICVCYFFWSAIDGGEKLVVAAPPPSRERSVWILDVGNSIDADANLPGANDHTSVTYLLNSRDSTITYHHSDREDSYPPLPVPVNSLAVRLISIREKLRLWPTIAAMVPPMLIAPLVPIIVWVSVGIVTAATAAIIKARDRKQAKKDAKKRVEEVAEESGTEPGAHHDTLTEELARSAFPPSGQLSEKNTKDRRPTPYVHHVPALSDGDETASLSSSSDESMFVMGDATEGLPLSSSTETMASTGNGSGSATGVPTASATTANPKKHWKRPVLRNVHFGSHDTEIPDYNDVLKQRRRSGLNKLGASRTVLVGSPIDSMSPAGGSAVSLADIDEIASNPPKRTTVS